MTRIRRGSLSRGTGYEIAWITITSIRMMIAIAALRNLEIHQMDIKTAFLRGDLNEEIYMEKPEGFSAPGCKKVCKVVKPFYGLKQTPK